MAGRGVVDVEDVDGAGRGLGRRERWTGVATGGEQLEEGACEGQQHTGPRLVLSEEHLVWIDLLECSEECFRPQRLLLDVMYSALRYTPAPVRPDGTCLHASTRPPCSSTASGQEVSTEPLHKSAVVETQIRIPTERLY